MSYALVNISSVEIIARWGVLPGRVDFGDNITKSPVEVGDEINGLRIVNLVYADRNPPNSYHDRTGETLSLDGNTLTFTISWEQVRAPSVKEVKNKARELIVSRYPEWKQANMTARAVELIGYKINRALTQDEQAEEVALTAVWSWIKSVREASDLIEAQTPIPLDFDTDERWPS